MALASSQQASQLITITQQTFLNIRPIPGSRYRLAIPCGRIAYSRMLTRNLPQRAGQKLSPMGMQALRLSGLQRNNPPWRRSMTDSEEVGDGVAVEGLAVAAWACLRPPLRIRKSAQQSSISSILRPSSFFGGERKAQILGEPPKKIQ